MSFAEEYLNETRAIIDQLDYEQIEAIAQGIAGVRRLFILGVGGSAATASHAVNDFRKICGVEAYAPTDNVAELTARTNDNGWGTTFVDWLKVSKLDSDDGVLILSVGGGDSHGASPNLAEAIKYARRTLGIEKGIGATIFGIVSRDGGYTKRFGDRVLVIPPLYENRITPHTEGLCSVILHLIVSHPALS
jgi:D-sedoheptulose 7-phosphate isomerase